MSASDSRAGPDSADPLERFVPPAEFERRIRAPFTDEELEETAALVQWFTRRYPTAAERFAWVRRAWRQWTRPTRLESP